MARTARGLTRAQLRKINEQVSAEVVRLLEQHITGMSKSRLTVQVLPGRIDRSDEESYRRISETEKDLAPPAYERHLRIAYYLYVTNPMAHRIIDTIRDFVIGDGASFDAPDERVKGVLRKHWNDPVNHWDLKQFNKVKELFLYGEQIYPVFVNEFTGHVRLGYIDPLNVEQVLPDAENPEVIRTVVMKPGKEVVFRERDPSTRRLRRVSKHQLRVVNMDDNPRSPSFGRLTGDCFYFAFNKVSNATRGFSELMHLSDWLDGYDQLLFTNMERLMFLRTFIWDILLKGGNEEQLKQRRKTLRENPPRAGSWIVHNESEEWKAVAPDLKATDYTGAEQKVRSMILGGAGIPPHWFGEGEDVNRATALAMDTPVFRMLKSRQRYVRFMIEHIFRFVIDQAILKKMIPTPEDDLSTDITVTLPEFSAKDRAQVAGTLRNVVEALLVARSQNWICDETAAKLIAMLVGEFGLETDAKTELQNALNLKADTEAFRQALERLEQVDGRSVSGSDAQADRVSRQAPEA